MLKECQNSLHGTWRAAVAEAGMCFGNNTLFKGRIRAQLGDQAIAVTDDPGSLCRRVVVAGFHQAMQIQEYLQEWQLVQMSSLSSDVAKATAVEMLAVEMLAVEMLAVEMLAVEKLSCWQLRKLLVSSTGPHL